MSFFVAALLRPEIQTIAQEELDAVTSRERLPTLEDRPRLPFVDAVCKEVMRWRPIAPIGELLASTPLACAEVWPSTGVPHATTGDDVYEGYFIPKGWYFQSANCFHSWLICIFRCDSTVKRMVRYQPHWFLLWLQPFSRAILHDPDVYPEPDAFKPERFLNSDGSLREDPTLTSVFGFGKRICPGRHLADAIFFIVVASFLSVFNIKKGDGTDGGPDVYPYTGGAVRCDRRIFLVVQRRLGELIIDNF
jgi:hypothetical protein